MPIRVEREERAYAGAIRVVFAAFGVLLCVSYAEAAPYLPWALSYFALAGVSLVLIREEIGEGWRPFLSGLADVFIVTGIAHAMGSVTNPVPAGYAIAVFMNSIVPVARRLPNVLAFASIISFTLVVALEWAGVLSYAPALGGSERPTSVQVVFGLTVVTLFILAANMVAGRIMTRLREEKTKADALLLNVLPEPIAARLKDKHGAIADSFGEVTVLFADVVGFTPMSSKLSAEEVVNMLNKVFTEFDDLAHKHRLEKIKTIGDAYMVAGGLPERRDDHAEAVAEMALEMIEILKQLETPTGDPFYLRVGMHTGPVVAGVIGKKKFSYDLWGDTVNTASRMESHGAPGRIHVTEAVFEKLKDRFEFEERGPVSVKGKGEMPTYFLTRRRT